MDIPLGLRFQPFDYDAVRFLFHFVTGRSSVDDEALIHEEDIFGDKEPWELIPSGKKMAYFLTRLKKKAKSKKGSRVERTVGRKVKGKKSGNWHGQDIGKAVKDGKFVMGYKRSFVYKNKREPEQDGQWLMKEFYLPETIIRRARVEYPIVEEREDFVLCRIQRKKKDDDDDDDEDEIENTSEQGGTSSNDFEAVPVEKTTLQIAEGSDGGDDDDINSYFVGVPVETLLAPADNMNSYMVDVPVDTISEGVPMETLLEPAAVNIDSYMAGVPVDTISEGVSVETLFAPLAGDKDTDGSAYISCGVPVETLPEPGSFLEFVEYVWSTEDVTTLIDFDA